MVELEIAFAAFGVILAGLCPVVIAQLKHVKKLESRFQPWTQEMDWKTKKEDVYYYVVPRAEPWTRKLAGTATVTTSAPGGSSASADGNIVTVLSLEAIPTIEDATAIVQVQAVVKH